MLTSDTILRGDFKFTEIVKMKFYTDISRRKNKAVTYSSPRQK